MEICGFLECIGVCHKDVCLHVPKQKKVYQESLDEPVRSGPTTLLSEDLSSFHSVLFLEGNILYFPKTSASIPLHLGSDMRAQLVYILSSLPLRSDLDPEGCSPA